MDFVAFNTHLPHNTHNTHNTHTHTHRHTHTHTHTHTLAFESTKRFPAQESVLTAFSFPSLGRLV